MNSSEPATLRCILSTSHVTHMNESRHTYEWVTPHIWMSHVTHMNESRHTYEWVTSHIWMSHVAHRMPHATNINKQQQASHAPMYNFYKSCHTYECRMSHISISHVTHMIESCHTYESTAMSHMRVNRLHLRVNRSCHTHEWVMSHMWMSHVTHTSQPVASFQPQGRHGRKYIYIYIYIYFTCLTWLLAMILRWSIILF